MCAPCKHKQALAARQALRNNTALPNRQVRTLDKVEFLQLYYIGPSDVEIPTSLQNVAYGTKPYGSLMFVARQDYEAHPELWTENEPTNNNITN